MLFLFEPSGPRSHQRSQKAVGLLLLAGGKDLPLSAATHIVFVPSPFSVWTQEQAACRGHCLPFTGQWLGFQKGKEWKKHSPASVPMEYFQSLQLFKDSITVLLLTEEDTEPQKSSYPGPPVTKSQLKFKSRSVLNTHPLCSKAHLVTIVDQQPQPNLLLKSTDVKSKQES
jgi:hypothetical protein